MNPLYISGRIKDKKRVEKYIHDMAEGIEKARSEVKTETSIKEITEHY